MSGFPFDGPETAVLHSRRRRFYFGSGIKNPPPVLHALYKFRTYLLYEGEVSHGAAGTSERAVRPNRRNARRFRQPRPPLPNRSRTSRKTRRRMGLASASSIRLPVSGCQTDHLFW